MQLRCITIHGLLDCGVKIIRPIFKTKMLIHQLKANLDVKILFGKITNISYPEIRNMLVRDLYGDEKLTFDLVP